MKQYIKCNLIAKKLTQKLTTNLFRQMTEHIRGGGAEVDTDVSGKLGLERSAQRRRGILVAFGEEGRAQIASPM